MRSLTGMGSRGYYNISTGTDCSIKELFDAAVKALGIKLDKEVEVRPRGTDDVYTLLIDPSRTIEDFQMRATKRLEEGVKATIEWYKKHGVTETFTHLRPVEQKR